MDEIHYTKWVKFTTSNGWNLLHQMGEIYYTKWVKFHPFDVVIYKMGEIY